jgi:hypothetical protein
MSVPAPPPRAFASFSEFYPFYLSEHANRTSRRLHFVGTSLATLQAIAAVVTGQAAWWLGAVLAGYGFAWVGHFAFEKNRPATFRFPLYSLAGDFAMARDILLGRIRW